MALIVSYKDLIVWQKSMDLVIEIYHLTDHFPKTEIFNLTSQLRRAGVSIPSNIAEGRKLSSKNEFIKFLKIAYGSGAELETQIEIAKRLNYLTPEHYLKTEKYLDEIMRMLNKIINNEKYSNS